MARPGSHKVAVAKPWVPRRGTALNLLVALRPHQWTKNLLIFAGLLFSRRLFDLHAFLATVAAFAIFCALSGVVYLTNDVLDRNTDRNHPLKSRRPIAAGLIAVPLALGTAVALLLMSVAGALALGWRFAVVAVAYVTLNTAYSLFLKHVVILDVLTISIGFVLRAAAGPIAINVVISHWLFVCTILLALFISLAKRRHEIVLLAEGATTHRPILGEYTPYLLDQMIGIAAGSSLIAYILYTISPENAERFGTPWLDLTIPFPLYGIFRYLYLVHRREGGGSPADMLLSDYPLLACVVCWGLAVVIIIYARP